MVNPLQPSQTLLIALLAGIILFGLIITGAGSRLWQQKDGIGTAIAVVALSIFLSLLLSRYHQQMKRKNMPSISSADFGFDADRAKQAKERKEVVRPPPTQDEELGMLDASPVERFDINDPNWLTYLDKEGYVVVANAATSGEVAHAEELLWQFLEAAIPWRKGQPQTWSDQGMMQIGDKYRGLLNGPGVAHSDFMWYMRTRPIVRSAFEKLWKCKDLLVSFDGANVYRPWHHGFRKTVAGWWHVDQGAAKEGRHAVQGLVSLFDADSKTGGFTVLPQSHLRHNEVVRNQRNREVDYCTVQPYSPLLQELPRRLICCKAGDLILWDSRTVHANSPAIEQPVGPANQLLRAVAYVCMVPKSFASKDVLDARRQAYKSDIGTSHWPQELHFGAVGPNQRSLESASEHIVDLIG